VKLIRRLFKEPISKRAYLDEMVASLKRDVPNGTLEDNVRVLEVIKVEMLPEKHFHEILGHSKWDGAAVRFKRAVYGYLFSDPKVGLARFVKKVFSSTQVL
jgi:hypothetical protein